MTLRVGAFLQERRLDKYLHGRFSNFSRAMIQAVIKAGAVKVNGLTAKPSFKISPDDLIELTLPELPSREIPPEDIPLNILHEDKDIIVINKPADIIVHPARGNTRGTIANALAFHLASAQAGEEDRELELPEALGKFRPGIVHRLDRNTTGVMILAKNNIAQW